MYVWYREACVFQSTLSHGERHKCMSGIVRLVYFNPLSRMEKDSTSLSNLPHRI